MVRFGVSTFQFPTLILKSGSKVQSAAEQLKKLLLKFSLITKLHFQFRDLKKGIQKLVK